MLQMIANTLKQKNEGEKKITKGRKENLLGNRDINRNYEA